MKASDPYPYLAPFARQTGIPPENLIQAYQIEKGFHERILGETDKEVRKSLYSQMYNQVHPLLRPQPAQASAANPFERLVRLFSRELRGRSILDVGCGTGDFLQAVAGMLPHGRLVGMDTSAAVLPGAGTAVEFIEGDVIDWSLDSRFEVVFSHHVLEHIAPADVPAHLASIRRALQPGGTLILLMPNRLFGPSDVTRIRDCSYTNAIPAEGSHLNEMSYNETIALLEGHGFKDFLTIPPWLGVKYSLPWLRIKPTLPAFLERSPLALRLMHFTKIRKRCVARMDVVLTCQVR